MRTRVADLLERARARTRGLTEAVDEADLVAQHSPLMSPLVWDLAHVGSQEELWLVRDVGGREPLRPEIDGLYDAFQHSRASRVELPLLSPAEARAYVAEVREKALDTLGTSPLRGRRLVDQGFAFGMIVQHEQQHDETMLATHQLRAGAPVLHAPPPPEPAAAPAAAEVLVPAGPFTMGTDTEPWALDNERPAHVVDLPAFWIDTVPVTNGAYAAFVDAGGYDDPRWWSDARLDAHDRGRAGRTAVLDARRRHVVAAPVRCRSSRCRPTSRCVHVCFFEAEAYAAWAGKRLPTEAEWEKAARFDPATGRSRRFPWGDADPTPAHANLGQRHLRPAPVGAYPAGASPLGVHQLIGDVWEWTSSGWQPYPGFTVFPYPEYSRGVLRRRLPRAARRLVRHRRGGDPRHVPQLGPPGPPADLLRVPLRAGRGRRWTRRSADVCRHLAYLGPPTRLAALLLDPPHGLLHQSYAPSDMRGGGTVNADGFGAGWYAPCSGGQRGPAPHGDRCDPAAGRRRPARYRSDRPLWSDTGFAASPRSPPPPGCSPRCARRHRACRSPRRRRRRSPRAAGCSATTAWSAGWPAAVAALAAALPVTDLLTLDAPTDSALLWALVRHRLRAGDDPAAAWSTSCAPSTARRPVPG